MRAKVDTSRRVRNPCGHLTMPNDGPRRCNGVDVACEVPFPRSAHRTRVGPNFFAASARKRKFCAHRRAEFCQPNTRFRTLGQLAPMESGLATQRYRR